MRNSSFLVVSWHWRVSQVGLHVCGNWTWFHSKHTPYNQFMIYSLTFTITSTKSRLIFELDPMILGTEIWHQFDIEPWLGNKAKAWQPCGSEARKYVPKLHVMCETPSTWNMKLYLDIWLWRSSSPRLFIWFSMVAQVILFRSCAWKKISIL